MILLFLSPASAGQDSVSKDTSRTWALVIGISKYQRLPGGQQLQFADRDAAAFADALKKVDSIAPNIRTLIGAQATASAIKSAIGNWLGRAVTQSDSVIIYFSGHGLFEEEFGESYLLASDSDLKDPYTTALSLSEINLALRTRVRARRILILADAVRRDLFNPETDGGRAAASFVGAFGQLAASRPGASVVLASGPGEFSREGQRWGGLGVFTRHLVDAFSSGRDGNGDGLITADDLFDLVKTQVAEDTSQKQHPWRSETPGAEFVLAKIDAPGAQAASASKREPRSRPQASEIARAEAPTRVDSEGSAASAANEASAPRPPAPRASRRLPTDPGVIEAPSSAPPPTSLQPAAESLPSPPPPRRRTAPPPQGSSVTSREQDQPGSLDYPREIARVIPPPPPKPVSGPPEIARVGAGPINHPPTSLPTSVPVEPAEAAPSPLVLQIEAAIASRKLLEPRNGSAWDFYQQLSAEPASAAQAARLKPILAAAFVDSGRTIVAGDIRLDNISELVDDLRRAGQMFGRARALGSVDPEAATLEKLGAAEALIALQFYDEAERALGQLESARLAAVENALGLVYQGKLENFRAERAFKRAIELNPKWAAPHYNLALVYRNQQNDQSLAAFEAAANIDPGNAAVLVAFGDECFARREWQRAAEQFRKAAALRPSDDAILTKLGHALYSQGLTQEANREYQKARDLRSKR